MAWQDLTRRIPMSRAEIGAHDAFLLDQRDEFYIVESGYADLFAVVVDDAQSALTRAPFIARIPVGSAFFGSLIMPSKDGTFFTYQAVPSRGTTLLRGKREHLASRETFDLDAVSLIDDWVVAASEFVARYEHQRPREVLLLEADPDVPYEARSVVSAHHYEVLWISVDQPGLLVGPPGFPVDKESLFPLAEHIWLTLPEKTQVSAIHTPGAIITGRLWGAMDRYNVQILRCASHYWVQMRERNLRQLSLNRRQGVRLQEAMLGELTSLLVDTSPGSETAHGHRSPLQAAAAIVADSAGVRLDDSPAVVDDVDPLEAVDAVVAPSDIRTRRIQLSPGWERRDGPSFLGVASPEEPRPVAVVNSGRGAYRMIDPVSGEAAPVNRQRAESLDTQGVTFYAPLARSVDSGLAALLQALRGRGRDIAGVALMGALGALVALVTPVVTGELLAEIIPRVDVPMWAAALAALALGAFTTAALSVVGAFSMLRIEARIDETLQAAVWSKLLSLPPPFFRRYLAGDLADRANGVSVIRQILTGATGASLVSGAFSIFSYALLFYYSWELALWTGVAVLLLVAGSWWFTTRQIHHQRDVFKAQGAIDGMVFQMIIGVAKLRQAHAERSALLRWSKLYTEQKRANLSARKWAAGQHTFNALFGPLSQLALLALIWYSVLEGGAAMAEGKEGETATPFALADFLSFHAAFGQFMGGMVGLTATWATALAVLPLFERVLPIIEAQPESVSGGTVLRSLSGRIEFEHVTFRYPSAESDTLQNVSFHIRPGEYVAFVGPSGAGKSTVYRLLLGFERPTAGSVLLDGHDLLSLNLDAMRRQFGVVLQNGQLTPASIFMNIVGEASLTEKEAWDAARAAGLAQDISNMPMGMHTEVPEGGVGLSGGQRQRLLIARTLARKPRVLLFDEATSMLDNRTQDTIRTSLRGLASTRVLIAHRLSTVVDVDRLYVMQDGRIVETGRYEELMAQGGVLAEMARRQMI